MYEITAKSKNTNSIMFSTMKQLENLAATNISGFTGSGRIFSISSLKYNSFNKTLKPNTNENIETIKSSASKPATAISKSFSLLIVSNTNIEYKASIGIKTNNTKMATNR
jgi:hypothetical protein